MMWMMTNTTCCKHFEGLGTGSKIVFGTWTILNKAEIIIETFIASRADWVVQKDKTNVLAFTGVASHNYINTRIITAAFYYELH